MGLKGIGVLRVFGLLKVLGVFKVIVGHRGLHSLLGVLKGPKGIEGLNGHKRS